MLEPVTKGWNGPFFLDITARLIYIHSNSTLSTTHCKVRHLYLEQIKLVNHSHGYYIEGKYLSESVPFILGTNWDLYCG